MYFEGFNLTLNILDTEIDFTTYLQHARQVFVNGVTNYSQITGDSGPIAYPAGFLYAFEIIRRVCEDGHNWRMAQLIFTLLYLIQLMVTFKIYQLARAPNITYLLAIFSKRLHSIFLLRMFNDCLTMPVMHIAILLIMLRYWRWGSLAFALALSIKMNVLLFSPAWLVILLWNGGVKTTIKSSLIILAVQLVVGFPFLMTAPKEYLSIAYNFGRHFEWEWTVNWRFLGKSLFKRLQGNQVLLLLHAVFLIYFISYQWINGGLGELIRVWRGGSKNKLKNYTWNAERIATCFFQCNLIGIICARSLHYQFYSWYVLSIPYLLLLSAKLNIVTTIVLFLAVEVCWNIYPSTLSSSAVLFMLNCMILYLSNRNSAMKRLTYR